MEWCNCDAVALGGALANNDALKALDLKQNSVGDAGASALGEALKTNTTLVKLHLHGARGAAQGARAV